MMAPVFHLGELLKRKVLGNERIKKVDRTANGDRNDQRRKRK